MLKKTFPKESICYYLTWDGTNFNEIQKTFSNYKFEQIDSQTLIVDDQFECLIGYHIMINNNKIFVITPEIYQKNFISIFE